MRTPPKPTSGRSRADEDYLAQCQAQGLYPVSYYPHNLHFLWAAATLEGRRAVARRRGAQGRGQGAAPSRRRARWTADFPVTPLLAYARFGLWQEVLTEPQPPANEPYATGIWHYARGLAFVAREQLDRADAELAALEGGDDARGVRDDAEGSAAADQPADRVAHRRRRARARARADADAAIRAAAAKRWRSRTAFRTTSRRSGISRRGRCSARSCSRPAAPQEAEAVYREDLEALPRERLVAVRPDAEPEAQQRTTRPPTCSGASRARGRRADITLTSSRIMPSVPAERVGDGGSRAVCRSADWCRA